MTAATVVGNKDLGEDELYNCPYWKSNYTTIELIAHEPGRLSFNFVIKAAYH